MEMFLEVSLPGSHNENISRLNLLKWADNQYNRKGTFSHI